VSLLVDSGLSDRFPAACNAWKSRNAESKEATQRNISEGKQDIDERLKGDYPLLEDALTGEITRRILNIYPYVSLLSLKNKGLTYTQFT